jgi:hypothetical protein
MSRCSIFSPRLVPITKSTASSGLGRVVSIEELHALGNPDEAGIDVPVDAANRVADVVASDLRPCRSNRKNVYVLVSIEGTMVDDRMSI